MKHFVAKVVKSFGRLGYATESLDDFRYTTGKRMGLSRLRPTMRGEEDDCREKDADYFNYATLARAPNSRIPALRLS